MGVGLSGRQLRADKKGDASIGKTTLGQGSTVMVVADDHGLPIDLYVASAQPHESQRVEATRATIRVPQKRGRPRRHPQELVTDKAYDSWEFRQRLRRRGIKPTLPVFARRKRRQPKCGRPIRAGASCR